MQRFPLLLCRSIFFIATGTLHAQQLPKHPTQSQIIGYHLSEQKKWNTSQLPRNSILYKSQSANSYVAPTAITFNKQKSSGTTLTIPPQNRSYNNPFHIEAQPQLDKIWGKKYWWRPAKSGSAALSGKKSNLQ